MSVPDFFIAASPGDVARHAGAGDRLALPCAVVHPACVPAIAGALGLALHEVEAVLATERAWTPATGLLDEGGWWEVLPDADYGAATGADGFAAHVPDLVLRHVPIEPERPAARGVERLVEPIDDVDVAYAEILRAVATLDRLLELRAPEILVRVARVGVQLAFDALVRVRSGGEPLDPWEPYAALMTGPPASPACAEPPTWAADRDRDDDGGVRDCFVLRSGFLVQFLYASVVLDRDGAVRDVFPTRGLRPVGDSPTALLLVSGGGPTASTGYFSPTPIVRDLERRAWVTGDVPRDLPRYVAGTIGDAKWAIVADLHRAVGYRITPRLLSDQCGMTLTSRDGAHAYDHAGFVVEAATGRRVLDLRHLGDEEVVSFVRRPDGAWRLVVRPGEDREPEEDADGDDVPPADPGLRVVDADGAVLCALPHGTGALAPDGRTVASASPDELALLDADTGERVLTLDLAPLARLVAAPADGDRELWRDLLAVWGTPAAVAGLDAGAVRAGLSELRYGEEVGDDLVERVLGGAPRG